MKHQHLKTEELLYFIVGILGENGQILQKNLIERKEHKIILKKIQECEYCYNIAKKAVHYNLLNSEEIVVNKSQRIYQFYLKIVFFIISLFLWEFDNNLFERDNHLKFLTSDFYRVKEIHTKGDNKREVRIYRNNKEIGTISVNENSYLKINDKKCKYNLLHLKRGSVDIILNENTPLCVLLDKKLIIVYNKKIDNQANLNISLEIDEEGSSYKTINSINGKFEVIVYPELETFTINEEESLDLI